MKVCLLYNRENNSTLVFKDRKLAEEYLKEWGMKEFESGIWAKIEEDIALKKYSKLSEKEVISNHEEKKTIEE